MRKGWVFILFGSIVSITLLSGTQYIRTFPSSIEIIPTYDNYYQQENEAITNSDKIHHILNPDIQTEFLEKITTVEDGQAGQTPNAQEQNETLVTSTVTTKTVVSESKEDKEHAIATDNISELSKGDLQVNISAVTGQTEPVLKGQPVKYNEDTAIPSTESSKPICPDLSPISPGPVENAQWQMMAENISWVYSAHLDPREHNKVVIHITGIMLTTLLFRKNHTTVYCQLWHSERGLLQVTPAIARGFIQRDMRYL